MLAFLAGYIPAKTSPMCGNSICQDRRFLARGVVKQGKHEALADIYESIEELKYYREHFLRAQAGGN